VSGKKTSKGLGKHKLVALEADYHRVYSEATDFAQEMVRQLNEILDQAGLSLAVPVEHRVKKWNSISDKLRRKELRLDRITDLPDLIGIRAIFLFRRDVLTVADIIAKQFKILAREDTSERLSASQFGYASIHFLVGVPDEWLRLPTLERFDGLHAELQLRSVAQHLWAASSHVFQYKQESSVPLPIRRNIYRVSALLETIDLEFERVLLEREQYAHQIDVSSKEDNLNVDSLASVLGSVWPKESRREVEHYNDLLQDLIAFNVTSPKELRGILEQHKKDVREDDLRTAKEVEPDKEASHDENRRVQSGHYYTWTGLTRNALEREFGTSWAHYNIGRVLPLSCLRLPKATHETLRKANIQEVPDLASATELSLMRLGVSSAGLAQVHKKLGQLGLHLGISRTEAAVALSRVPNIMDLWLRAPESRKA
jgi:ppGpp synthetase/RelA/SpoT-type nucleotidyltranferase/cation transport regulator ChaB